MAKKGKKYLEAAKLVEVSKAYAVTEAIEVAKKATSQNSMRLLKLLSV